MTVAWPAIERVSKARGMTRHSKPLPQVHSVAVIGNPKT